MAKAPIQKMCNSCGEVTKTWDNRENKKFPNSLDYRCSVCGWEHSEDGSQKASKPKYTPKNTPKVEKEVDWDGKDRRICRLACHKEAINFMRMKYTVEYLQGLAIDEALDIFKNIAHELENDAYRQ